jgi:GNAT superfamily N-acetyltransferase
MSDIATPAPGPPPFVIEPLSAMHDRAGFACGVEVLDRYFISQATQDIRRRVSACFVAGERGMPAVAGYYTIAASSIPLPELSQATAKKMPRYPLVPAVRIGRLAVALSHRGKGIGAGLLIDGIARAYRAEITAFAIVVDAKDAAAIAFYRHYGFAAFASAPMTLYLPLAEAAKQLGLKPR